MRTGRVLAFILGALAALLGLGLLTVWLLVNPQDYQSRIVAAVHQATGRDLLLDGRIKLALFPWIALRLGPASLRNPPGFSAQPFLSFAQASVRLRLLPLFARRLEFGQIEIDGLDVRLATNAAGGGNWQHVGRQAQTPPLAFAGADASVDTVASPGFVLDHIDGVKIVQARVSFQDVTVEHIDLETGAAEEHGLVPVTLHAEGGRQATATVKVDARFDLNIDTRRELLKVAALNLNSVVTFAGNPRPVRSSLSAAHIDLDLAAQTLAAPDLALNVAGAQVNVTVQGVRLIDAPQATGSISLAPVLVREYLPRIGVSLPPTRDPKVWSRLEGSSRFSVGADALRLNDLKATLDDTKLTGSVVLHDPKARAVDFDLTADQVDLDRYLAPAGQVSRQTEPADAPVPDAVPPRAPIEANGTLAVGSVHLALMKMTDLRLTLSTHDRIMHLFPATAQIDGGRYTGDITLDSREPVPTLSLDEHLTDIDVGQLRGAKSGSPRLSGRGSMNLKAVGHGVGADAILRTLAGHFDATIAEGALEGIDLRYEFERANAFLNRAAAEPVPNTRRTPFTSFKLSAQIDGGVADTHDLVVESRVFKITGQGTVDLPTQTLDLALLADTKRSLANASIQIPVNITGTMSDPKLRANLDQVKEALKDRLRRLFGKP
jgi:AsmA protein